MFGIGLGSRLAFRALPCFLSFPCAFSRALLGAFSRTFLRSLGSLRRLIEARIGRTVGDEIGGKHAGHVRARRVVLPKEARQRGRRNGLQKAARALVAGVAGPCEKL